MRHEKRAHTLPTAGLEVSLTLVSSACKHVVAMVGGLAGEDRVPHHQLSTQGRRPLHRWHPRSSRRGARSSTAQPQSRCAHQTRLHSMESVRQTCLQAMCRQCALVALRCQTHFNSPPCNTLAATQNMWSGAPANRNPHLALGITYAQSSIDSRGPCECTTLIS